MKSDRTRLNSGTSSGGSPRGRTLRHPGPFDLVRIRSKTSTGSCHFRLLLAPGVSLFEGLVGPLRSANVTCASTTILGGACSALSYCVAPPDPSGAAVIAYTAPITAGRAYFVFGNATVALSADRQPLVHCHAVFRTEGGDVKGGHVLTDRTIVGPQPISVLVTPLEGFELRVALDSETNVPLIKPMEIPR